MNIRSARRSIFLISVASIFAASSGWGSTSLSGSAELSYVKYDAAENGKELSSGSTLAQKYALAYSATNLVYRIQPRYYSLMVGYEWVDFKTKLTEPTQETVIKQNFGKLTYSGEIGYNPIGLPIRFKAYINDVNPLSTKTGISPYSLIDDGLTYTLEGRGKSVSSGVSLAFEPRISRNTTILSLPRVLFEYRDTINKSTEGPYQIDNRIKELAVAGLNQENNWVNYRLLNFQNYRQPLDNTIQQQFQIGLVDHRGRRLWSALTNWIDMSADAQLTDVKSPSSDKNLEEYDVNLMAIAKRQKWDARTFMNYNRQFTDSGQTSVASVPLYVRGIYGSETDWHVGMSAVRGRQFLNSHPAPETSSSNLISLGLTTFSRSKFTFSPSISLNSRKDYSGTNAYTVSTVLETASTRRFSEIWGLDSKATFSGTDDGSGSSTSKSWVGSLGMEANYQPPLAKFGFTFTELASVGSGTAGVDTTRFATSGRQGGVGNYLRNFLIVSSAWTPTSRFSMALYGSHDYIKVTDLPANAETSVSYRATYDMKEVLYRLDSKYSSRDNGVDALSHFWQSTGEAQYHPDRYNDAAFKVSHSMEKDYSRDNSRLDLTQNYSYSFYSKTGVVRNIASLSESYSFSRLVNNPSPATSVQSLLIGGRYSPTDRYSLYGSAKYEITAPSNATTMYYTAGLSADFRLLATSVDYTLVKRDIDNRIEKKIAASVRRSF